LLEVEYTAITRGDDWKIGLHRILGDIGGFRMRLLTCFLAPCAPRTDRFTTRLEWLLCRRRWTTGDPVCTVACFCQCFRM